MEQILARGELFYDELNNCWLNVGEGIMKNQFGLLSLLQRSNYNSFDTMLTKGIDLMNLGLPINRNGLIVDTFGGPFSDSPCRPQDLDWIVPKEYEVVDI